MAFNISSSSVRTMNKGVLHLHPLQTSQMNYRATGVNILIYVLVLSFTGLAKANGAGPGLADLANINDGETCVTISLQLFDTQLELLNLVKSSGNEAGKVS